MKTKSKPIAHTKQKTALKKASKKTKSVYQSAGNLPQKQKTPAVSSQKKTSASLPAAHAEVLAPAGNQEALQAAIAAGADAVYLGLPQFGARAFAQNFTLDEVKTIIQNAHLAGMKIYITMNTLLEESQIPAAYEQAKALYEMGVDALILQDLGLIHYLHHRLPELELHASTQLSVTSPGQIERLKKIGISRVVMAREAALQEIEEAAKTGMELEVFIHGALCISYSGQCQFSRIRYGRSGNKGACAQPCRMEYTLLEDGKPVKTDGRFLLSPKDLSILPEIPALEKAGAASLKIEGRMKSPEYVYTSVQKAKKAQEGKRLSLQDEKELMTAFNRGYTKGHTFDQTGKDLMNPSTSNHQGIPIGKVLRTTPDKITIQLEEDLHQNDGIRFESERSSVGMRVNFLYQKGKLTSSAKAGDIVEVDAIKGVYPKAIVRKTVDSEMEKHVQHEMKQTKRQSAIAFRLENEGAGKPLILHASDGKHCVTVTGEEAQPAINRPLSIEDFVKQLSKTGNTWAQAADIDVELKEDIFLPLKAINQLRSQAIEALEQEKLKIEVKEPLDYTYVPDNPGIPQSYVEVSKPGQIQTDLKVVSEFPLVNVLRKQGLHAKDQPAARAGQKADGEAEPALFEVSAHLGDGRIVDGMNITNAYALAALLEMGYEGAVLSEEISEEGLEDLLKNFKDRYGFDAPVIADVYEKPRLMIMRHCPVNTALKDGTRKNCSLCRSHQYELEGKDGKRVSLYGSPSCQMRLYDESPVDQIGRIPELEEKGIHAFRVSLTTEDAKQSKEILERFKQALDHETN